jgi:predicted transcriptional regulator
MARTPFTLRIDREERAALENLSKIEGRPMNQLLNEAIKGYLMRRGPKESGLETHLAALRAYRELDPRSERAISAFIEAEVTLEDPVEGKVDSRHEPAGPVQSRIRELMRA